VRKTLRDLGFGEISSIYWKMRQGWFDLVRAHKKYLDLPSKYQPVELAFHNIRTLFRFRCFENLTIPNGGVVNGCGILWATILPSSSSAASTQCRRGNNSDRQDITDPWCLDPSAARWGGFNETDLALGLKVGALCVCPPQSTVLSPHDEHNFPNTHIAGWCKRLGSHCTFSCAARVLLLRGTFCSCLRSLGGSCFFSPFPCNHFHRHCFRYCHRDHPYHHQHLRGTSSASA